MERVVMEADFAICVQDVGGSAKDRLNGCHVFTFECSKELWSRSVLENETFPEIFKNNKLSKLEKSQPISYKSKRKYQYGDEVIVYKVVRNTIDLFTMIYHLKSNDIKKRNPEWCG